MLDIQKHRLILTKILKDIFSDFELSSILGLKGGTALYYFYSLPRFSVDLDFNLLQGLGEILDKELKIWVKNNLISETVFYLRNYLEEIERNNISK